LNNPAEDAEWSDMPESAIKTGYVDYVLSVEAIAQKISQIMTEQVDKGQKAGPRESAR
jgi:chemotaxis response regulator CheB